MATIAELEAYMDKIEERYFALYPNPQEGQRGNWESIRGYIGRVKNGDIPGTTPETETPRATEALIGFRRCQVASWSENIEQRFELGIISENMSQTNSHNCCLRLE